MEIYILSANGLTVTAVVIVKRTMLGGTESCGNVWFRLIHCFRSNVYRLHFSDVCILYLLFYRRFICFNKTPAFSFNEILKVTVEFGMAERQFGSRLTFCRKEWSLFGVLSQILLCFVSSVWWVQVEDK